MEELKNQLCEKTGIDRGTADKISAVLSENVNRVDSLLADDAQGLVQLLQKVGIDEGQARRVVAFLKENVAKLPAWLGGDGGQGFLGKARNVLGGILGGKEGK